MWLDWVDTVDVVGVVDVVDVVDVVVAQNDVDEKTCLAHSCY